MPLLIDFPDQYAASQVEGVGSIDEVTWMTHDAVGSDVDAVPGGAALFVRGWAIDTERSLPPRSIFVRVDGSRTYEARVGSVRLDIADAHGNPDLASCGFEAVIPTGRLESGTHRLSVWVINPETRSYARLAQTKAFRLVTNGVRIPDLPYREFTCVGILDAVVDESQEESLPVLDGAVTIAKGSIASLRGWACATEPAEPFDALFAVVDGTTAFSGIYGSLRPDVATDLGERALTPVGFDIRLSTAGMSAGAHRVGLIGVAAGGGALVRTPLELLLFVGDALAPRVVLREMTAAFLDDIVRIETNAASASPAPLRIVRGDRLFVRGWAFDEPAGTAAGGVVLVIDGDREVTALYGLPRPDVAEAFGNAQLARTGFTCEIQTGDLPTGLHSAACRVIARDGRGAFATAQRFDFEVCEG